MDEGVTMLTIYLRSCRLQLTKAAARWPGLRKLVFSFVTLGRMEIEMVRILSSQLTELKLIAVDLTPEYVAILASGKWDRLEYLCLM